MTFRRFECLVSFFWVFRIETGFKKSCVLSLLASLIAWGWPVIGMAAEVKFANGSYLLEPLPNYVTYPVVAIKTVLLDGKYATGTLWTDNGGLAWKDVRRVSVTLDLGAEIPIDALGFHGAARGAASVEFPYNALVYLSRDGERFAFFGDAMGFFDYTTSEYRAQKFLLKGIGKAARYVRIEFFVRGRYFAIDEVEIVRGGDGASLVPGVAKDDISDDAGRRAGLIREQLSARRTMTVLDRAGAPVGASPLERRNALLAHRFPGREFVMMMADPWAADLGQGVPETDGVRDEIIYLPIDGCDYRAFVLSNPTSKVVPIKFSQSVTRGAVHAELTEAASVTAATLDTVFDPLVIRENGKPLQIMPGASRVFVLKLCGNGEHILRVEGIRSKAAILSTLNEVRMDDRNPRLAGVAWAYLDEGILRGRADAVTSDLRAHYINVSVVPFSMIPSFDEEGAGAFERMLSRSAGASRILLFLNFRQHPPRIEDLIWRQNFVKWYGRVMDAARRVGVDEKTVMLYPYDEPSGTEVAAADAFYVWARSALSTVRFFSTIDRSDAVRLMPKLDIACVTREMASRIPMSGEVWLYDVKGPGKTNPPYSYYRLLPWEAYFRGMSGVGFWSYADVNGSAWDDFDGRRPDYGVVYESLAGNGLLTSRRWEAWRMGMEDVSILRAYAERFGDRAARRKVQRVLAMPGDSRQADVMRQLMLRDLATR